MNEYATQILNYFDSKRRPLSDVMADYLRSNSAIGASSRRDTTAAVYNVMRYKRRVDAYLRANMKDVTNATRVAYINDALLLGQGTMSESEYLSYPDFIYKAIDESQAKFFNSEAEVVIRVDTQKIERAELQKKLAKTDIDTEVTKYSPFGLTIGKRTPLTGLAAYREGLFEVQEEASQLIAMMAAPHPKWRVLDACAGEGGKTLALSMLMRGKGDIFAFDTNRDKLTTLKGRVKRTHAGNIHAIDSLADIRKFEESFDLLLLDVPCSGLGTIRRHPDLKWRWSEEGIKELAEEQKHIVREYLPFVAKGGYLLYATCSFMREENEDVAAFIKNEFAMTGVSAIATLGRYGACMKDVVSADGYLKTGAHSCMDGFFGALFQRR